MAKKTAPPASESITVSEVVIPQPEAGAPEKTETVGVRVHTTPPAPLPKVGPAPGDTVLVPTTIRVSRSVKFKKDASTPADEASSSEPAETIEVHRFATTPASCYVGVDLKKVKDYNSAGIMVGATVPCYAEEIAEGMERAYNLVMERLKVELPKIIQAAYDLRDARIAERERDVA